MNAALLLLHSESQPTHLDSYPPGQDIAKKVYVSEHGTDMYVNVHEFMNVYVDVCTRT